ncbi:YceI family protein [Raineyella fluvialis]|uniref:Polyisoprenoid-binding protein n=1 Tax=Raineyella fluvialis TaxID=2662261 RepID=A0A5Q2F6T3_9ACTN|nr:YceI family protein [Raineyella fluvialis]QGF22378.1 polyisoprenoid-binding protein [Raineyella fluvialis]
MTELVPGTWTIDPAHSEVAFTIRHMMSKVRGHFGDVSGTIVTGSADPKDATVEAHVAVASIDTNQAQRDEHIRTAEILGAAEHPTFDFTSTSIVGDGDDYKINGDLTIKGITKPVTFDATFNGAMDPDAFGLFRMGAEGTTVINKKDFGIEFNIPLQGDAVMLGDKVTISVTLEATLNR